MKAISLTFNNLDFIVDSFQLAGTDWVISVIEDAILEKTQSSDKCLDRAMLNLSGHSAPIIESLFNFPTVAIVIKQFELIFQYIQYAECGIQLQKRLVNSLDRFGVKVKMVCDILNGHNLAKTVNVSCQPMSDPPRGIGKTELFDFCSTAIVASDFPVLNLKPNLGTGHVQVAKMASMPLRVNSSRVKSALVAARPIPQIGGQFNQCRTGIFAMNSLVDNFNLRKRKILCYTKFGHCATPFVLQVIFSKELISRKTV